MASPFELALQQGWGAAPALAPFSGTLPAGAPSDWPPQNAVFWSPIRGNPDRSFLSAPPGVPAGQFRTPEMIYGPAGAGPGLDWLTGALLYDPATDKGDWLLRGPMGWWNRFTDQTWHPGDPTPKGVNPQVSTTAKPGPPEPQVAAPATDFLSLVTRLAGS